MAMVSRNVPPWAAVSTIMPAAGGPSSTSSHSSGEKAALFVMSYSCVPGDARHVKDLAVPGAAPHPAVGESSGERQQARTRAGGMFVRIGGPGDRAAQREDRMLA